MFLQGGNSRLWQIHYQDGAWSGFQQFSSLILMGSPAAVVRAPGMIDVMWRDNSSRLAYMGWNGSQWSAVTTWSNISVASPPGLVATGPQQLMAAVSGSDNRPYVVTLNGTTWSTRLTSPTGFGAMHFRTPALVSWATNRVDLIYSLSLSRVGHLSWF